MFNMTSPNSVVALVPPSRDSMVLPIESDEIIDLSVLFQTPNIVLPDYLSEIDSIIAHMRKDRKSIDQYVMDITTQMDEECASLKAELKSKSEQMERICETYRQKEQSLQEELNSFRSDIQSMENVNLLSTVYFKEMMKRFAGAVCDGEEFIKSIDCSVIAGSNEAKNECAPPETLVVLDDSDDEAVAETTTEQQKQIHRPTAANDQPGPSNVVENDSIITDDGESIGEEKENIVPPTNAQATEPVETGDEKTVKTVKSVLCKWCDEIIPKKLRTQHRWNVHKVPPKDNKTAVKLVRSLKRKIAADDQSEDEVSISSVTRPSLAPLRARGQCIIKPKKAKKMVTSSPA